MTTGFGRASAIKPRAWLGRSSNSRATARRACGCCDRRASRSASHACGSCRRMPPRPHNGCQSCRDIGRPLRLPRRFVARQVFERSADQAGFFEHGKNRMVMPAVAVRNSLSDGYGEEKDEENGGGGGGGGGAAFGSCKSRTSMSCSKSAIGASRTCTFIRSRVRSSWARVKSLRSRRTALIHSSCTASDRLARQRDVCQ